MSAPPRFFSSVHAEYPDDDFVKEVTLHELPMTQDSRYTLTVLFFSNASRTWMTMY